MLETDPWPTLEKQSQLKYLLQTYDDDDDDDTRVDFLLYVKNFFVECLSSVLDTTINLAKVGWLFKKTNIFFFLKEYMQIFFWIYIVVCMGSCRSDSFFFPIG